MAGENTFDLIVIGAGPGGYVGAIRAAQLGMKVACVDKGGALGGTCLNVGCIPSKALLDSSELYHMASSGLGAHGIGVGKVELDLGVMMARKDKVVADLTTGIAGLFKKNKISAYRGTARLASPTEVAVSAEGKTQPAGGKTQPAGGKTQAAEGEGQGANGKKEKLSAPRILLATGSEPVPLPFAPFDGKQIISSTEALTLRKVPKHMIVIGGGAIGLELGSVWLRLGAKVTVVEMLPVIMGGPDAQIHRLALRSLTRQGMEFHLETRVTAVAAADKTGRQMRVSAENSKGEPLEFKGDVVLVSIGRRPYAAGLGAQEAGVIFDEQGRVAINENYQTNLPSIYAIGDVVAGPMLAHKASEEGIAAVERMAGLPGHMNYGAIPSIVYTWPEVAWVGKNEQELKAEGLDYRTGSFPFMASGRAKAMGETEGMVKIIADARTDQLLGVHVFGPRASDVIAEAAIAFEFGASAEDLARAIHAHPTLSEAVKEAALAVDGRAIHM